MLPNAEYQRRKNTGDNTNDDNERENIDEEVTISEKVQTYFISKKFWYCKGFMADT